MTLSSTKNRVIFLDLIRAFAVLNMVQGHTIDVLLGTQFRNLDNIFFLSWWTNRGLTAPIFLFTAGTVFTYLFRLHKEPAEKNPRTKKGFGRFFLLLSIGYIMHYPTWTIINFESVTPELWSNFFRVDVLHLIGVGILLILLLAFLSEKTKLGDLIIFSSASIIFFVASIFILRVDWINYVHPFFAGYLYGGTGSYFPLFPWLVYIFAGSILGSILAKKPDVFKTFRFTISLLFVGLGFLLLAIVGNYIEIALTGKSEFWTNSPNLVLFRLGIVILLNSLFTFIALKMKTIPKIVILLGRNTLLIYVVHILILYGSAWNIGLYSIWREAFNPLVTILAALAMIGLMISMVYIFNRFNFRNRSL